MLKRNYLILTLFITLVGMPQRAKSMSKSAKLLATSAANVTCILAAMAGTQYILGNYLFDNKEISETTNNLHPKTESFVLETLLQTYPELKNYPIQVIADSRKYGELFAVTKHKNVHYIYIPFNDDDLEEALHKKKCTQKKCSLCYHNYSPETLTILEECGFAATSSTLDLWRGAILHEGSHIKNDDVALSRAVSFSSVVAGYALMTSSRYGKKIPLPLFVFSAIGIQHGLGMWQEYRADQESIERADNPSMLHALKVHYRNSPELKNSTPIEKIKYLLDTHPNNATRAAYFEKAAHELEKKLTKKHT